MKPVLSIILFFLFMSSTNEVNAQIKSKKFGFVLNTMLSHKVPEISITDAAKNKDKFQFLDAREMEEWDVSRIPNAMFVGAKKFEVKQLASTPKDKPLIVYCSIGKRSEEVAEQLIKAGYTNVHNLYGGIFEWVNQDQRIVDKNNKVTNTVHAFSRLWGIFLDKGKKVY